MRMTAVPSLFQMAAAHEFALQAQAMVLDVWPEEEPPLGESGSDMGRRYTGEIEVELDDEAVLDVLVELKHKFVPDDGPNEFGDHYFARVCGENPEDRVAHYWAERFAKHLYLALRAHLPDDDVATFTSEVKIWLAYSHLLVVPDMDGVVLAETSTLLELATDIEEDE